MNKKLYMRRSILIEINAYKKGDELLCENRLFSKRLKVDFLSNKRSKGIMY